MLFLDPTLDLVFELMLTREPTLLRDMLQRVVARPVRASTILDSDIPGDLVRNKLIQLDIRTRLDDGSRADIEMQRRVSPALDLRAARPFHPRAAQ